MNSAGATLAWSLAGFRGAHDPHNAMEMGERFLPAAAEVPASDPAIAQFGNLRVKRQQIECKEACVPLENLEMFEGTGIITAFILFSNAHSSYGTFRHLSSVFRSRSVLQLENLALRRQIGVLSAPRESVRN